MAVVEMPQGLWNVSLLARLALGEVPLVRLQAAWMVLDMTDPKDCWHMGTGEGPIIKVTVTLHEGREITWVQLCCPNCGRYWHGDVRPGHDIDKDGK